VRQRIENGDMDSSLMTWRSGYSPRPTAAGSHSCRAGAVRPDDAAFTDASPAAAASAGKKTLDWLMSRVAEKVLLRPVEAQNKSPEMLASLSALAAYWNQIPGRSGSHCRRDANQRP